jgi:hypothetical protein
MCLENFSALVEKSLPMSALAGWIPSADANGNRAWIKGCGSGLRFLRQITKWQRYGGGLPEDIQEQTNLWAKAEVDGANFGEIARMNRLVSRNLLRL